ncbi:MAG TPA: L,D-transpeptidase family protein [Chthoniobacteraceae bacterium]|nr:L,D-transpeptidase family protein [Chthoniobacteraceae bacterium]
MKTAWKLSVSLGAVLLLFPLTVQSASRSETKASVEQKRKEHSGTEEQNRLLRLQIFLDDSGFRPGAIDGHWGEFTRKALARYQQAQGQEKSLQNNRAPDDFGVPLDANSQPLTSYQITEADEKSIGPVAKSPEEQSKLKTLMYGSIEELVAEKFHANIDLIKKLNPGSAWKANETVQVPNIATPFDIEAVQKLKGEKKKARSEAGKETDEQLSIEVDTEEKMLDLRSGDKVVASYPITPGSERLPAPKGEWKIDRITWLPPFRWDKEMLEKGKRSSNALNLPSGPNSVVGILWMELNKEGIGIHGTSEPETIGRSTSHGCVRLSNWDAFDLAQRVSPQTKVLIR